MAQIEMQNVIDSIKRHPEMQPYFWRELIDRKGKISIDILFEHDMFDQSSIQEFKEKDRISVFSGSWQPLAFIEMYINKYPNIEKERIRKIVTTLREIMKNKNINEGIMCQIIKIYSLLKPYKFLKQDINIFKRILREERNRYVLQLLYHEIYMKMLKQKSKYAINIFILILNYYEAFRPDIQQSILRNLNNKNHIEELSKLDTKNHLIINSVSILEKFITKKEFRIVEQKIEYLIEVKNNQYYISCDDIIIEKIHISDFKKDLGNISIIIKKHISDERLVNRISRLLLTSLYNNHSFRTIYSEEKYYHKYHEYLVEIIKHYLKSKAVDKNEIENFLNNRNALINKIALYAICENFDEYRDIVIKGIEDKELIWQNILTSYIFGDEVVHLFNKINNDKKCIERKELHQSIEEIINQGEFIPRRTEEAPNNHFRQSRFRELTNIDKFKKIHQKLLLQSGIDYMLAPAISDPIAMWTPIKQKFPYTIEQLNRMTNETIVKVFNDFNPQSMNDTEKLEPQDEYSYEGGWLTLEELIKESPNKIIEDINPFLNLDHIYLHGIYSGYRNLPEDTKKERNININTLIDFTYEYLKSNEATDFDTVKKKGGYPYSFIEEFMWMMAHTTPLNKAGISKFLDILGIIFGNNYYYKDNVFNNEEQYKNLSHYLLNTVIGTSLLALLNITLDLYNSDIEEGKKVWNSSIKPLLDLLKTKDNEYIYFITGKYLSNFNYIDISWGKTMINELTFGSKAHSSFMAGYSECSQVSKDIISLLKTDIILVLKSNKLHDEIKERLSEKLTMAFVYDEDSDNNLISEITASKNLPAISGIISTAWNVRPTEKDYMNKSKKIIEIWEDLIKYYKSNPQDKVTITRLLYLLESFDYINDTILHIISDTIIIIKSQNDIYFDTNSLTDYLVKHLNTTNCNENDFIDLLVKYLKELTPVYTEAQVKLLIDKVNEKRPNELEKIREEYLENSKGLYNIFVKYLTSVIN